MLIFTLMTALSTTISFLFVLCLIWLSLGLFVMRFKSGMNVYTVLVAGFQNCNNKQWIAHPICQIIGTLINCHTYGRSRYHFLRTMLEPNPEYDLCFLVFPIFFKNRQGSLFYRYEYAQGLIAIKWVNLNFSDDIKRIKDGQKNLY